MVMFMLVMWNSKEREGFVVFTFHRGGWTTIYYITFIWSGEHTVLYSLNLIMLLGIKSSMLTISYIPELLRSI